MSHRRTRPLTRHAFTVALVVVAFALGRWTAARVAPAPPAGSGDLGGGGASAPKTATTTPASVARDLLTGASSANEPPERDPPPKSTREQLLRSASRIAALRAAVETVEPRAEPWPDPPPTELNPPAFEGSVLDAIDEVGGGELLELDCDEFPCVATVAPSNLPQDGDRMAPFQQAMDIRKALEEQLGVPVDAHMDGGPAGVFITLSGRPEDFRSLRLDRRLEDAWKDASR